MAISELEVYARRSFSQEHPEDDDISRWEIVSRMEEAVFEQAKILLNKYGEPQAHPKIKTILGGGMSTKDPVEIPDRFGIPKLNVLALALTNSFWWDLPEGLTAANFLQTPEVELADECGGSCFYSIREMIEAAQDHYAVRHTGMTIEQRYPEGESYALLIIHGPSSDGSSAWIDDHKDANKVFGLLTSMKNAFRLQYSPKLP
ncbi:hypothetical protein M1563_04850 [Patescibacteria group bacterium]|nr:hypothetical protein [Patescibacteria group bacterium]